MNTRLHLWNISTHNWETFPSGPCFVEIISRIQPLPLKVERNLAFFAITSERWLTAVTWWTSLPASPGSMTPAASGCLRIPEPDCGCGSPDPQAGSESCPQKPQRVVQKLVGHLAHSQNCPSGFPVTGRLHAQRAPDQFSAAHRPASVHSSQSEMVGICWKHSLLKSTRTPFVRGRRSAHVFLCPDSFLCTRHRPRSQTQAGKPPCSWRNSPGKRPGWVQRGGSWGEGGWDTPCCRAAPWWRHHNTTTRGGWSAVSKPPPWWHRERERVILNEIVRLKHLCSYTLLKHAPVYWLKGVQWHPVAGSSRQPLRCTPGTCPWCSPPGSSTQRTDGGVGAQGWASWRACTAHLQSAAGKHNPLV